MLRHFSLKIYIENNLRNTLTQSNNIAIVGKGLIGKHLAKFVKHDWVFDSKNINTMPDHDIDTVYVAAPSSNRVWVKQNPELDWDNVELLKLNLLKTAPRRVVLISSYDTQVSPETAYSKHRLNLENFVKEFFHYYHIIRLSGLISNNITKNILYDIKHKTQWVDSIKPNIRIQWYVLDDLEKDLEAILSGSEISVTNLGSEPILTKDILDEFHGSSPEMTDQVIDYVNLQPYKYNKEEIFKAIRSYMQIKS